MILFDDDDDDDAFLGWDSLKHKTLNLPEAFLVVSLW